MNEFDAKAQTWENDPVHLERSDAIAQCIRQIVPLSRDMRALEVGCGTGLLSFALRKDLGSVTATDPSQGMIDVLQEKINRSEVGNIVALRMDLSKDPPPSGLFDLVFLQMALHHIPDVDGFLHTTHDLLSPHGWVCVADLDTEDGSFHGPGALGIHLGFDRSDLVHHVEEAGFQALDIDTAFEIGKRFEGVDRFYPVFLLVARKD